MAYQHNAHYAFFLRGVRELDFTTDEHDPDVRSNASLGFDFRMARTSANDSVRVYLVYPYSDNGWVLNHAGGVICIALDADCLEELKTWLRDQQYPVDTILRRKRLKALIE